MVYIEHVDESKHDGRETCYKAFRGDIIRNLIIKTSGFGSRVAFQRMNDGKPASVPKISVIVPVRNEATSICTLIEGLLNQTLRPSEIVITDGGSTDKTPDIIEQFVSNGAPVRLLREKFSLPGRARNIGAANAREEWLAFTDAGTRPESDWLERLVAGAVFDSRIDVIYGSFEPKVDSFFEECAAIAYVPAPDKEGARPWSIVSALMRRKVWESVGGFPEDLRSAEDLLFMRKVEAAGFRITRAPDAIVHWNVQPNLFRTFTRFLIYARNNIRAGLWREWQLAIFLRYAALVLSAIPAAIIGWRWLIVPIGLWLGLMLARAVKSISRNATSYRAGVARNTARLFLLVPILATIDAAALLGSVDWLLRDKLRLGKRS